MGALVFATHKHFIHASRMYNYIYFYNFAKGIYFYTLPILASLQDTYYVRSGNCIVFLVILFRLFLLIFISRSLAFSLSLARSLSFSLSLSLPLSLSSPYLNLSPSLPLLSLSLSLFPALSLSRSPVVTYKARNMGQPVTGT